MTQWGMQILGSLLAGTARWVGTVPALGLHSLVLLAGIPPLQKLPRAERRPSTGSLRLADVIEGVREVRQSRHSRPRCCSRSPSVFSLLAHSWLSCPLLIRDFYTAGWTNWPSSI